MNAIRHGGIQHPNMINQSTKQHRHVCGNVSKRHLYDTKFRDPQFRVPRRPLVPGRVYHFNVIYNCQGYPIYRTDDSDLALRVATALVERLELRGYVNSYYYHRDHRPTNSLEAELNRVLSGSSATLLLLTPDFIINGSLKRYLNLRIFRRLLDQPNQSLRLLILSVGVPKEHVPDQLCPDQVLYFHKDWEIDVPSWNRFDRMLETLSSSTNTIRWCRNICDQRRGLPKPSRDFLYNEDILSGRRHFKETDHMNMCRDDNIDLFSCARNDITKKNDYLSQSECNGGYKTTCDILSKEHKYKKNYIPVDTSVASFTPSTLLYPLRPFDSVSNYEAKSSILSNQHHDSLINHKHLEQFTAPPELESTDYQQYLDHYSNPRVHGNALQRKAVTKQNLTVPNEILATSIFKLDISLQNPNNNKNLHCLQSCKQIFTDLADKGITFGDHLHFSDQQYISDRSTTHKNNPQFDSMQLKNLTHIAIVDWKHAETSSPKFDWTENVHAYRYTSNEKNNLISHNITNHDVPYKNFNNLRVFVSDRIFGTSTMSLGQLIEEGHEIGITDTGRKSHDFLEHSQSHMCDLQKLEFDHNDNEELLYKKQGGRTFKNDLRVLKWKNSFKSDKWKMDDSDDEIFDDLARRTAANLNKCVTRDCFDVWTPDSFDQFTLDRHDNLTGENISKYTNYNLPQWLTDYEHEENTNKMSLINTKSEGNSEDDQFVSSCNKNRQFETDMVDHCHNVKIVMNDLRERKISMEKSTCAMTEVNMLLKPPHSTNESSTLWSIQCGVSEVTPFQEINETSITNKSFTFNNMDYSFNYQHEQRSQPVLVDSSNMFETLELEIKNEVARKDKTTEKTTVSIPVVADCVGFDLTEYLKYPPDISLEYKSLSTSLATTDIDDEKDESDHTNVVETYQPEIHLTEIQQPEINQSQIDQKEINEPTRNMLEINENTKNKTEIDVLKITKLKINKAQTCQTEINLPEVSQSHINQPELSKQQTNQPELSTNQALPAISCFLNSQNTNKNSQCFPKIVIKSQDQPHPPQPLQLHKSLETSVNSQLPNDVGSQGSNMSQNQRKISNLGKLHELPHNSIVKISHTDKPIIISESGYENDIFIKEPKKLICLDTTSEEDQVDSHPLIRSDQQAAGFLTNKSGHDDNDAVKLVSCHSDKIETSVNISNGEIVVTEHKRWQSFNNSVSKELDTALQLSFDSMSNTDTYLEQAERSQNVELNQTCNSNYRVNLLEGILDARFDTKEPDEDLSNHEELDYYSNLSFAKTSLKDEHLLYDQHGCGAKDLPEKQLAHCEPQYENLLEENHYNPYSKTFTKKNTSTCITLNIPAEILEISNDKDRERQKTECEHNNVQEITELIMLSESKKYSTDLTQHSQNIEDNINLTPLSENMEDNTDLTPQEDNIDLTPHFENMKDNTDMTPHFENMKDNTDLTPHSEYNKDKINLTTHSKYEEDNIDLTSHSECKGDNEVTSHSEYKEGNVDMTPNSEYEDDSADLITHTEYEKNDTSVTSHYEFKEYNTGLTSHFEYEENNIGLTLQSEYIDYNMDQTSCSEYKNTTVITSLSLCKEDNSYLALLSEYTEDNNHHTVEDTSEMTSLSEYKEDDNNQISEDNGHMTTDNKCTDNNNDKQLIFQCQNDRTDHSYILACVEENSITSLDSEHKQSNNDLPLVSQSIDDDTDLTLETECQMYKTDETAALECLENYTDHRLISEYLEDNTTQRQMSECLEVKVANTLVLKYQENITDTLLVKCSEDNADHTLISKSHKDNTELTLPAKYQEDNSDQILVLECQGDITGHTLVLEHPELNVENYEDIIDHTSVLKYQEDNTSLTISECNNDNKGQTFVFKCKEKNTGATSSFTCEKENIDSTSVLGFKEFKHNNTIISHHLENDTAQIKISEYQKDNTEQTSVSKYTENNAKTLVSEYKGDITKQISISEYADVYSATVLLSGYEKDNIEETSIFEYEDDRTEQKLVSSYEDDNTEQKLVSSYENDNPELKLVSSYEDYNSKQILVSSYEDNTEQKLVSSYEDNNTGQKVISYYEDNSTEQSPALNYEDDSTKYARVLNYEDDNTEHTSVSNYEDKNTENISVSEIETDITDNRLLSKYEENSMNQISDIEFLKYNISHISFLKFQKDTTDQITVLEHQKDNSVFEDHTEGKSEQTSVSECEVDIFVKTSVTECSREKGTDTTSVYDSKENTCTNIYLYNNASNKEYETNSFTYEKSDEEQDITELKQHTSLSMQDFSTTQSGISNLEYEQPLADSQCHTENNRPSTINSFTCHRELLHESLELSEEFESLQQQQGGTTDHLLKQFQEFYVRKDISIYSEDKVAKKDTHDTNSQQKYMPSLITISSDSISKVHTEFMTQLPNQEMGNPCNESVITPVVNVIPNSNVKTELGELLSKHPEMEEFNKAVRRDEIDRMVGVKVLMDSVNADVLIQEKNEVLFSTVTSASVDNNDRAKGEVNYMSDVGTSPCDESLLQTMTTTVFDLNEATTNKAHNKSKDMLTATIGVISSTNLTEAGSCNLPETDEVLQNVTSAQAGVVESKVMEADSDADVSETVKWKLPVFKGVCHVMSYPDMPYLG